MKQLVSGFLYRVTHRIESNRTYVCRVKLLKDTVEISFAFGAVDVNVDLLSGKRRPEQTLLAMLEVILGERQTGARPIQLK